MIPQPSVVRPYAEITDYEKGRVKLPPTTSSGDNSLLGIQLSQTVAKPDTSIAIAVIKPLDVVKPNDEKKTTARTWCFRIGAAFIGKESTNSTFPNFVKESQTVS